MPNICSKYYESQYPYAISQALNLLYNIQLLSSPFVKVHHSQIFLHIHTYRRRSLIPWLPEACKAQSLGENITECLQYALNIGNKTYKRYSKVTDYIDNNIQ